MKRQVWKIGMFVAVGLLSLVLLWPATTQATPQEKQKEQVKEKPPEKEPEKKEIEKVYRLLPGGGFEIEDALTGEDPKDKVNKDSHFKSYLLKMTAGTRFTFRLNALDQVEIDAFLRLEDESGKVLAFNDDAEGEVTLNSRIDFKCAKNGTFRLICTTSNSGETGKFTLGIQPTK